MSESTSETKKARGRPRRALAHSHKAILDTVYDLLQEKSVRDLTMEEVARRAGVGKPTLYKWWPTKIALVMDMFEERVADALSVCEARTGEAAIQTRVAEFIDLLNGFLGKVATQIIAEGQSDPGVLDEYRQRYLRHRIAFSIAVIDRAKASGEFTRDIDAALLTDMIYGPIYYRLLLKEKPLDQQFGRDLVTHLMAYVKG